MMKVLDSKEEMLKPTKPSPSNMHPLKLKIELLNAPVKIVRKVLVPEHLNMWQLHLVIQDAMGWLDMHLFEFKDRMRHPEISVYISDGEEYGMGMINQPKIIRNPDKAGLSELFVKKNQSKPFFYWYDFGDDWMHKISFQKVSKKDLTYFKGHPICIDATGSCPPEDIGGVWGYAALLEAIDDEKHPQHRALREWMDVDPKADFDPNEVDLEKINFLLETLTEHEIWNNCPQNLFN